MRGTQVNIFNIAWIRARECATRSMLSLNLLLLCCGDLALEFVAHALQIVELLLQQELALFAHCQLALPFAHLGAQGRDCV